MLRILCPGTVMQSAHDFRTPGFSSANAWWRLGEMMAARKETVGFNRGTAGMGNANVSGGLSEIPRDERPTLAEAGIDKNLAGRTEMRSGCRARPVVERPK